MKLPEIRDVFLFGGLAAMGYGVHEIHPPSAYVLVGIALMTLGILIYMAPTKQGKNNAL